MHNKCFPQLIPGCCFREGCLLPNENTNRNIFKMSNKEVVRKLKDSRGRRLGPYYVNAMASRTAQVGSTSSQGDGL